MQGLGCLLVGGLGIFLLLWLSRLLGVDAAAALTFNVLVFGYLGFHYGEWRRFLRILRKHPDRELVLWRMRHGSPIDGLREWEQELVSITFDPMSRVGCLAGSLLLGLPLVVVAMRAAGEKLTLIAILPAVAAGFIIGRFFPWSHGEG